MRNEEKILTMLEQMQADMRDVKTEMRDNFQRVDGKLAGLQEAQARMQREMEKGFKETRETIVEVVDAIDKKFERLQTTA